MSIFIPILTVVVGVIVVAFVFWFVYTKLKSGSIKSAMKRAKTEDDALKQAHKRLSKNPNDPEALSFMGEIYYNKPDWERVLDTYRRLAEMPSGTKDVDEVLANLRVAEACIKLGQLEDSYKYLVVARALDPSNFDVNYQLGALEFLRKNYEKSVQILQGARALRPDHAATVRTLGHAFFRLKKNKEAMQFIRQSIDLAPNDKESLMTLAECYCEAGQTDQALKIYAHLRPDPTWGAQACLSSGIINVTGHQDEAAIQDFEIGLKHKEITEEIDLEIRYQLANAFIRTQEIGKAMDNLNEIVSRREDYKDTEALIKKYNELFINKNLRIYTMSSVADFVALCRKIALAYFPKARVKITKTNMHSNDWLDIQAEVDTPKWSDVVMFRFIRTQGSIGELVVRDFHSHLKDAKAGKGICMGVGQYSDEARRFTEARLIDLIDKPRLTLILNTIEQH
jgi:tetratricopeptide (TPR) repeat protein